MAVVIAAKRVSPIASPLDFVVGLPAGNKEFDREGESFAESFLLRGRHLSTASTDALHGWTWSGYENITRMTMAALPTVEVIEGASATD